MLEVGNVGRCRVFEQPGRAISCALAEPTEFKLPCRAPQQSRAYMMIIMCSVFVRSLFVSSSPADPRPPHRSDHECRTRRMIQ